MSLPRWWEELNIVAQARKYGVPLWQHPQFLFLVMGAVIIATMLFVYAIGLRLINDPLLISLLIIGVTGILLVMAFIITRSFERLAAANRLKTEFVNIVSHQLRAPLSNLSWASEFLLQGRAGKLRGQQAEYLEILKENSGRMQELVQDLLQASRIEEGEFPFEKNKFSFPKLIEDIVQEFQPRIQAARIAVLVEGAKRMPAVFSDEKKIREVVANLFDNAIQYAWQDGEAKKIRIRYGLEKGKLRFEIEDNGIGIAKEDQRYIFQRFFRSRAAQRHETHGTGLGLYIAKFIVKRAGGGMGFRSKEHKGSTFWFTIPIT